MVIKSIIALTIVLSMTGCSSLYVKDNVKEPQSNVYVADVIANPPLLTPPVVVEDTAIPESVEPIVIPEPEPEPVVYETVDERINRLASAAGITATVGECNISNAIACYFPSRHNTVVTAYGLTFDDNVLACALRHEARHKWQDEQGLIEYDTQGNTLNRAWLEDDAYTNGCR